jgi:hypothetical protein
MVHSADLLVTASDAGGVSGDAGGRDATQVYQALDELASGRVMCPPSIHSARHV